MCVTLPSHLVCLCQGSSDEIVVLPAPGALASGWSTLSTTLDSIIPKLPTALQTSARALGFEFYQLRAANNITSTTLPQVIPWFHNETARSESRGRDMWQGTQPWMPLFIEYEAVYYHVPFSKWKLKESPMLSNWGASVLQCVYLEMNATILLTLSATALMRTSAKVQMSTIEQSQVA